MSTDNATQEVKPLTLPDGRQVSLERAGPGDAEALHDLYQLVYSGNYTLDVVNNRPAMLRALADPTCLWLLVRHEGNVVGSVIFFTDPAKRSGKVFAAVVHPQMQRSDLMTHTIGWGIERLFHPVPPEAPIHVIYATTRTATRGPHLLLKKLGFVSLGVFPNVHRLAEPETHELNALFHPDAFAHRRRLPKLIPEVAGFYNIIRQTFQLEPAEIHKVEERLKFNVVRDGQAVIDAWEACLREGSLTLDFFPFHRPNVMLVTEKGHVRAFLHLEGKDGHAGLIGLQVDRDSVAHMEYILTTVFEQARTLGVEYLEIVVSAYEPRQQRAAFSAGYLPCAYFPAMGGSADEREDYIIFAKSTLPLNFANMQMTPRDRQFLDVYLRNTEFKHLVVNMYQTGPLD